MSAAGNAQRRPEFAPEQCNEFAIAVIEGLSGARKNLPCRFFYDARGNELFEQITQE
jgi:uncharacterized SAM-dependent methyltransferase